MTKYERWILLLTGEIEVSVKNDVEISKALKTKFQEPELD